ncbi:unnamed protein product [Hymenolepis diminuta]|uniref:Spondin-like TSP1 domain-containing protein n=1 Tax=Hymenolepis diminuta TaxID=6216 RepID=A0A3P7BGE5_HYMDI|nr:unnamed protein product [Hymenolepis diminuta]
MYLRKLFRPICRVVTLSQTERLPLQTKDCVKALNKDECRPYWGSWTAWSACTATCGVSERQRYRSCNGDTCADISRAEEGMERRDCPLQRICPRIWGEFSVCDATCGRGHRRRIRLCNKPIPQGGGVPCQGLDTQLVSRFSCVLSTPLFESY